MAFVERVALDTIVMVAIIRRDDLNQVRDSNVCCWLQVRSAERAAVATLGGGIETDTRRDARSGEDRQQHHVGASLCRGAGLFGLCPIAGGLDVRFEVKHSFMNTV